MIVFMTSQECNHTPQQTKSSVRSEKSRRAKIPSIGERGDLADALVGHGLLGVEVQRHHGRNGTGQPSRSARRAGTCHGLGQRLPELPSRLDRPNHWNSLLCLTLLRFPHCRVMVNVDEPK
jgi:hypothetical protein